MQSAADSFAVLLFLSPISLTIVVVLLATPVAFLCGILLKYRQTMMHLVGQKDLLAADLKTLAIFGIFGVLITLPVGWTISRLILR